VSSDEGLAIGSGRRDVRRALLDAAADLVRRRGPGLVSLRETARQAGVSHAAPAHHFRDKAGLLTALATEGYRGLAQSIETAIAAAAATDARQRLHAVGVGYVRFALERPAQFEIMFRMELLRPQEPGFGAEADRAYGLLIGTIEQAAREGRLRGRDPGRVALAAWSMVHGFASLWVGGRLRDRVATDDPVALADALSRDFVEAFLD
jgi:AcrR family transcriptional regulator